MKRLHLTALSLLSALLLSLSWPANGFPPLIFIAWIPLLFIQDYLGDTNKKGLFWYGWLSFLAWNALTTWWIWNSTEIGGIGAIVLNSLFMAVVFWLYHFTKKHMYDNKKGFFILIFFWLGWEWFHLDWDLSWPWLNLGHVFSPYHKWIQWYEVTGVAGGTAWILLVNILLFKLLKKLKMLSANIASLSWRTVGILAIIVLPILASLWRYSHYEEDGNPANVIVVQPNFDPYSEQYELSPIVILNRNLDLAQQLMQGETDFIVSPESAIQDEIWEEQLQNSASLQLLDSFLVQHPSTAIVIGASSFSFVPEGQESHPAARRFRSIDRSYFAYNTAFFLQHESTKQLYHKSKLTPGVEMMPSWWFLRPLQNYAIDLGGTIGTLKTDAERKVFQHADKDFRVAPVICYESVYGEFVTNYIKNGANLIFIITNDGWWGNTPGHRQHLEFAKLRAIETRRSIARSANTGISAFVNQKGDIQQATAYWEEDVIKQAVYTNENLTFYVRFGDYLARISIFISAIFLLNAVVRKYLKKRKAL